MLKRPITYKDFNDREVTDIFYFNLTKAELVEMEWSVDGGLGETMKRVIEANDAKTLIGEFKRLILTSYGEKSDDGKRFIKNDKLREEFEQSAAYSALFMELATNSDAAVAFIQGVIPSELQDNVQIELKTIQTETVVAQVQTGALPPPPPSV